MPEALPLGISRCGSCGAMDGGALARCRACGSEAVERVQVAGRGRLVSWTVVRRPGGAFAHRPPFAVALVDLDAGVRVTGNLAHWDHEPALDAAVCVVDEVDGVPVFEERAG